MKNPEKYEDKILRINGHYPKISVKKGWKSSKTGSKFWETYKPKKMTKSARKQINLEEFYDKNRRF